MSRNIIDNNLLVQQEVNNDYDIKYWGLELSVIATNANVEITLPFTRDTTPSGEIIQQTEGRVLIRKKDNSANTVTIKPFAGCVFNGILGNIVLKSQNDYITFSNNNGNVINIHDTNLPNLIKIDNVDLKAYIDNSVAGLLDYRGVYDASTNQYPTTGGSGTGGAVLKSDTWIVSVAGILNSQSVKVGDMIIAQVNNPTQTPANWNVLGVSVYNNSISNSSLSLMDAFTVKMNNTNAPANPQDVLINTAFNKTFETSTTNIKMNGTVSVGVNDNIARADHVHPSDTTKQNIISGAVADDIVSTNNLGQVIDSGKAFSTDTGLSSNSNNKIPTEQVLKYNVDYLNNRINNLPIGAGIGSAYYFTNDINGSYLTLSANPKNGTQAQLQTTVNNNTSLLGSFVTATALNRTIIDAGIWEFNLWVLSDSTQATTNVYAEVYKLNSANVETLLFTLNNSNNIGSTTVIQYSISGTQPSYAVLSTDKLLIKLYAKTTRTQNTIVTVYYNSAQYYSHAHTPLVIYHNNLAGIQGGNGNDQNYHLTQTQYNNITNQASTTQTGYLSNTDFNTFSNKQTSTLTNGNILVGNSLNVATNVLMSGDGTLDNTGKITVTKTNNVTFAPSATTDTTNASNINSGTLPNNRLVSVPNSSLANSSMTIAGNNTALGGTVTQDQITGLSANGLVKRTLANTLGIATVNDLPFTFNNVYYVSPNGNNSNDGKTLAAPVLTLAQAQTLAGNSGVQIVVLPGTYTENTLITAQNISIVAPNREQSGIVNFTGTITANNSASSIRVIGLNINTFIHANTGSVYLYNSSTTSLSKTGNGYLQVSSSNSQSSNFTGTVSITGAGSVLFINKCTIGITTINNSSAVFTLTNNTNSAFITLTAGTLGINNTPIYASSETTSAVTVASSSVCYITNSAMLTPTNANARITMSSGSFYSLNNVVYDKANSILSGAVLTRTSYSDSMELTTPLSITSGGTGSGVRQTAINNLAGAVTNAQFLRGNGTNVVMSAIQVTDVPTLNQNTTGSSGSVKGTNVITNTNLSQMATNTLKGNNTNATANASDLTGTQVTAILDNFVGDSGSGGTKGLVPAPASGDGAANKYLDATGQWSEPNSGGSNAITITYNITGHGFTNADIGKAVFYNGTNLILARSDIASTLATELILSITNVNSIITIQIGALTLANWTNVIGTTNLTPSKYYFVSNTNSGQLTATEPSTGFSNPMLKAISGTTGIVLQYRPSSVNNLPTQSVGHFLPSLNSWDGLRRLQLSIINRLIGSNITLNPTNSTILLQPGIYKLTACWQIGSFSGQAGEAFIRWYNETTSSFFGQDLYIPTVNNNNAGWNTSNILIETISVTSPTSVSIRDTGSGTVQPISSRSYVLVEQFIFN